MHAVNLGAGGGLRGPADAVDAGASLARHGRTRTHGLNPVFHHLLRPVQSVSNIDPDHDSQIKEHTLSRLADYLEEFEARAKENGAHVHWARESKRVPAIVTASPQASHVR